jgi:hypothetical protein
LDTDAQISTKKHKKHEKSKETKYLQKQSLWIVKRKKAQTKNSKAGLQE